MVEAKIAEGHLATYGGAMREKVIVYSAAFLFLIMVAVFLVAFVP